MNFISNPAKLAYCYGAASIFIGPGILTFLGNNRGGFDCFDPAWGSMPLKQREAILSRQESHILIASSVMLALGVVVLVNLLGWLLREKPVGNHLLAVLVVLLMMAGYGMIVLFFTSVSLCGAA